MEKHNKKQGRTAYETSIVEARIIALAEEIGSTAGSLYAKTEALAENAAVAAQLARIRDAASELLARARKRFGGGASDKRRRTSRAEPGDADPVHAPGKKHRRPPAKARGVPHSNQQVAKAKLAATRRMVGQR